MRDVALPRITQSHITERATPGGAVHPAFYYSLCEWNPGVVPHGRPGTPVPQHSGEITLREFQVQMPSTAPIPCTYIHASEFFGFTWYQNRTGQENNFYLCGFQKAARWLLVRCSGLDQQCPQGSVQPRTSQCGQLCPV